ncbi:MAG: FkbM family methyltransferase [Planctomycetota bacterium]
MMRAPDVTDFLRLRRISHNPLQVLRFRKAREPGSTCSVRLRDGPPLTLRSGTADYHIFSRIFLREEYRLDLLPSRPLGVVVDVGANVGLFSARIAPRARRILAVEPISENFRRLERNTRELPHVERIRAAVAGKTGPIRLLKAVGGSGSGRHSLYSSGVTGKDTEEVPAYSLEDLLLRHGVEACDLLKLDCEGAEYEILLEAPESTLSSIERIHMEYHNVRPEDPRTRVDHLVGHLERSGLRTRIFPHRRHENHGMLFCRR